MKMRPVGCILGAVCALTFGFSAMAAEDAAPVDLKALLDTLKKIKETRSTSEKLLESRVMQDFRTASASNATAIAFYEQAISAIQYDGKNHDRADFKDWLKDNDDDLKSDAMQNAVRLHLNYAILTLQRAKGATTKQLEPALMAHISALLAAGAGDTEILRKRDKAQEMKDLGVKVPAIKGKKQQNEPLFWTQDMINTSVTGSIFVQWYGVQKMFSDLKDWEQVPGNIDGMYQNTLLPYYRLNKDIRAVAYWDDKIQKDAKQASSTGLSFKIEQFNSVKRPQLLWKRAQEMLTIGQRNRAINEMLGIIKSFPDHPDLPGWLTQLEGIITNSLTPATPVGATPNPAAASGSSAVVPASPAPAQLNELPPLPPAGPVAH